MTHKGEGKAKLPTRQLAILAVMRFAEPVASTSVTPYLPEMIESFGIPKKQVAKWAGVTSAVFSLSQCVTAVPWGRFSDKAGRKPAILSGLTFTLIASLFFGMSQNLAWAISARTIMGAVNGNVGIIRTTVAEMVREPELQPLAFSIMPLVWSIGSILGPSLGGFAQRGNLPWLWERSPFLQHFPFVLPNLIASVFFCISITVGILFLKETLDSRKNAPDYGLILGEKIERFFTGKPKVHHQHHASASDEETPLLGHASKRGTKQAKAKKINEKPPTITEVFTKQSAINLFSYSFLAMHSMAFDQTLAVFMHHDRQTPNANNTQLPFKFSGGFGLPTSRIGVIFTAYGIIGGIVQFIIFPPVARRYGVLKCYRATAITFPIVYLLTPYTALIQSSGAQQAAMFGLMVIKCICGIFAFPCSTILLTNSAASLRLLGTLNGLAVSMSAIGRAAGPALTGAMFTWGVERGYMITPWWVNAFVAFLGIFPTFAIIEMPGFGADDDQEPDSEEEETAIIHGDETISTADDETLDIVEGPPLNRIISSTKGERRDRRMSGPIGLGGESIGPGGGRKLSNGLGYSNSGQPTSGPSLN